MTDGEEWRPVPGHEGFYEVSNLGRIRGVHRVILRKNGVKYTAQGRMLRLTRHHSGRRVVILARGRRGEYRYHFVDRLVQTVFGYEALFERKDSAHER